MQLGNTLHGISIWLNAKTIRNTQLQQLNCVEYHIIPFLCVILMVMFTFLCYHGYFINDWQLKKFCKMNVLGISY